jgi:hypothetical protein
MNSRADTRNALNRVEIKQTTRFSAFRMPDAEFIRW